MGVRDLKLLSEFRMAVVCPSLICWAKPKPAAFMINLPGHVLANLFTAGIYVYEKQKPSKKGETDNE